MIDSTRAAACEVGWLGRVPYADATALQAARVEARSLDEVPDSLLLLEHPHVITTGRRGDLTNLLAGEDLLRRRGVGVHLTERGGDVTYHGPGQLVGYPIMNIRNERRGARRYVHDLEEAIIRALAVFGLTAHRNDGKTGVWVGSEKIAAIGIHISRGITSHGFALNVSTDLTYFDLIIPCGIREAGVISMSRFLGREMRVEEVLPAVSEAFGDVFSRRMQWVTPTPTAP
jgi:lipoyl(octanoyl) transferase